MATSTDHPSRMERRYNYIAGLPDSTIFYTAAHNGVREGLNCGKRGTEAIAEIWGVRKKVQLEIIRYIEGICERKS